MSEPLPTQGTDQCPMSTHYARTVPDGSGGWRTEPTSTCQVSHVSGAFLLPPPEPCDCARADLCQMDPNCPHHAACILIDDEENYDDEDD